ncbi:hypothetical protein L195_g055933 [Trifolium pratense]|uniref:Uncharacterized protein n=1 Tax=Trifolium pratense TaxID=57577 RepID=A0A2K3KNX7_TRIPR|nr:hypothetical protein L195_g055933 [Trifolium pratense]
MSQILPTTTIEPSIEPYTEPYENNPSEEETIQLTQNPNPKTDGTVTPNPTIVVPSQVDTPPIMFKSKKAKSYDSSKIRRSSESYSELEKIVLEPLTSSKFVPLKTSPASIKKVSATAVKVPKKKNLLEGKCLKMNYLKFPLIHPEEEAKFEQ